MLGRLGLVKGAGERIAATAALTLLLAACGGTAASAGSPAPASAAKPAPSASAQPATSPAASAAAVTRAVRKEGPSITFKFASSATETDISGDGYKHWAKLIEERTGGRIKFQFFWAASLLTSQRMFEGLRDGLADFGGSATASMSGQVPDVAPFEVPFAYPLESELLLPMYSELNPLLSDVFKAYNQQMVYISPHVVADPVSCKSKFLDSANAWKGALVRTAGKWQARTLEVWGAKPVTIDSSEAYSAIQRGTADCLLYAYNLYDSGKMYEVAKYVTRIDHSINMQAVAANADAWKKLPPEDQQILLEAGKETQGFLIKERDAIVPRVIDKAKQNGVKFCTPSQQELQRLRNATEPVLNEIAQQQSDRGKQMQAVLSKFRAQVKQLGPTDGDMTPCPGT